MDVQSIVNRARSLSYVSSGQYNDTLAIEDFNIAYTDLVSSVIQLVNEDFFYDTLTTDTVIGQSEYILDTQVNKAQNVWIQYATTTGATFVEATPVDKDALTQDISFYETSQSTSNPIYYIADESLFIFPSPTEVISPGLKMDVSLGAVELVIADLETSIVLPEEFHRTITLGMLPMIYQRRGLLNESNNAQVKYENAISDMVQLLTDRISVPTDGTLPDLTYYE